MEKTFSIRLDAASQTFSAAHFITFDSSACEALHGHDFHAVVDLEQPLSPAGYVIDFLQLSAVLQKILKKLDHKTILQGENPKIRFSMEEVEPDEQPDMMNWMSKVGGWLSSVNQYGTETERELNPDDYFQKMAQMAADEMNPESKTNPPASPGLSRSSNGAADVSAFQSLAQAASFGISSGASLGASSASSFKTSSAPAGSSPGLAFGSAGDSRTDSPAASCEISNGMTAQRVELEVRYGSRRWLLPMEDCVILPIFNATAEQLAEYVADQLAQSDLLSRSPWTQLLVQIEEAPGMKGACTLRACENSENSENPA